MFLTIYFRGMGKECNHLISNVLYKWNPLKEWERCIHCWKEEEYLQDNSMGKEIKKLESRQDVLDVWVSKWAVIEWFTLDKAVMWVHNWKEIWKVWIVVKEWNKYPICPIEFDIEKILYSPESNFFELFWKCKWCWECDTKRSLKDTKCNVCWWKLEEHNDSIYIKTRCVTSSDPLQYLKDNLNETLGSQQEDNFLQEVNAWDVEKSTE